MSAANFAVARAWSSVLSEANGGASAGGAAFNTSGEDTELPH